MLRKLQVLAISALLAVGGLAATASPSAAGHRGSIQFGIGVGFGDHHGHWRSHHRHWRPHHRHWRPRHHGFHYSYRYYDRYPDYYVPLYRRYQPPIVYRPQVHYRRTGVSAHVDWCHARYRSYRAWDNTFQPYHGPRRQCRSPYAY